MLCLLFAPIYVKAQASNFRTKTIVSNNQFISLDSLTLYWTSLQITDRKGRPVNFEIDPEHNAVKVNSSDTLYASYRVFSENYHSDRYHKDTAIVFDPSSPFNNPYIYSNTVEAEDFFGGSSLKKSGSISRGINIGNTQNLSVNSSLNMQLSGNIGPNLKLLASLSDANIPIQADGNTNKLQEFDQLFIQLYNEDFKLTGGDFWLNTPKGYFMQYKKRAQGLTGEYRGYLDDAKTKSWSMYASGAFSKGKYNRQMIYGTEGNQGPYKLIGADNEAFIVVLAGTEQVFLDGHLLKRGQEYDYTINYNTAELTFTPRQMITKNSRIIVAFQYSAQSFARSLITAGATYETSKVKTWINVYSEQDAKNQPLQQTLTNEQKKILASVGDSVQNAYALSIDSIAYSGSQVMYKMVDTLGYDSVLVFSVDQNLAHYSAKFASVGAGKGNYVFDQFNALGRVYKWVAPVGGVPQGNYAPVVVLIAPKKQQMLTGGAEVNLGKQLHLFSEVSVSNNEVNTFSRLDRGNDVDMGAKTILSSETPLSRDSLPKWKFTTKTDLEYIGVNFNQIQRFRSTEFERDWNILGEKMTGYQFIGNTSMNFVNRQYGHIGISGGSIGWGKNFNGFKGGVDGIWKQKGFQATWEGSVLSTQGIKQSLFARQKADISQGIAFFRLGFKDEFEHNLFKQRAGNYTTPSANYQLNNSYQFLDWQFYFAPKDSSSINYRLYYSQRNDEISDSVRLKKAATAHNIGGAFELLGNQSSQLRILANYRQLDINDTTLTNIKPEKTLLGRVEYNLNVWKGSIRSNTFYEIGSGLELKKEFVYIQVNPGMGIYTWNDYNGDGVKDLNEFEVAAYSDQATYIRVFTPSNRYVKTYNNELSQSLMLQPERVFASKKGFLKFLSHFSNQTQFRIARKTNSEKRGSMFNPFENIQSDTSLLSLNSSIRNTFYFNRTNQVVGADYAYNNTQSKTLLANGFDGKQTEYHQLNTRWNIIKQLTWKNTAEMGTKRSTADYTSGRNYKIEYIMLKPELSYQPGTAFRISTSVRLEQKVNRQNGNGEQANITDIGLELRYNQMQKGSLGATFNFVNIRYDGVVNDALGFAMLEALKPGKNYTWSLLYQRNIGKNLQLSIRYNGRKSENNKTIHAGGVELRAFF